MVEYELYFIKYIIIMEIIKLDYQKNDSISETIKINSNLRDTYLKYQELV